MPRRDGSGPMGAGSMTGRGLGPCGGARASKYGAGPGMGLACRRGFGGGFQGSFAANQNVERLDKDLLEEQKELLQSRIDAIDEQLEAL